jgi:hypothetical protein
MIGATFTQLGCTGSSFTNGIEWPNVNPDDHKTRGPAQFGNWDAKRDLNPRYDAAEPDVVLLTMGADDMHFVDVVIDCVVSYHQRCIPSNPGPVVQKEFLDSLGRFPANLRMLLQWIHRRGDVLSPTHAPKVVVTDYYDPFPPVGERCPDTLDLSVEQLSYLDGLLKRMDSTIRDVVQSFGSKDVALVELHGAFRGHSWCSSDPWAYGLSIESHGHYGNPAPFHPTPVGQLRIARLVKPVVEGMLPGTGT